MARLTDNIMFIPAVVLLAVEAVALIFLIWAWFDANKGGKRWQLKNG